MTDSCGNSGGMVEAKGPSSDRKASAFHRFKHRASGLPNHHVINHGRLAGIRIRSTSTFGPKANKSSNGRSTTSKNSSSGRKATSRLRVSNVNLPMPSSFPGTNSRPFKAMRAIKSKVPLSPITFASIHESTFLTCLLPTLWSLRTSWCSSTEI